MKQIAGSKGGNSKGGQSGQAEKIHEGVPVSDDDILGLLPGKNPYDHVVLKAKGRFTYLDGKTREQVNGEVLSNEKASVELAKTRGALLTVSDVEERDEKREEIFLRALKSFIDLVPDLVPPQDIQAARQKATAWHDRIRKEIAEEIDAK